VSRQVLLETRRIRAFGQPESAAPGVAAEAPLMRRDPGAYLQAQPGVRGQQRQHRVRGS
jgi:hypothetical protein